MSPSSLPSPARSGGSPPLSVPAVPRCRRLAPSRPFPADGLLSSPAPPSCFPAGSRRPAMNPSSQVAPSRFPLLPWFSFLIPVPHLSLLRVSAGAAGTTMDAAPMPSSPPGSDVDSSFPTTPASLAFSRVTGAPRRLPGTNAVAAVSCIEPSLPSSERQVHGVAGLCFPCSISSASLALTVSLPSRPLQRQGPAFSNLPRAPLGFPPPNRAEAHG